MRRLIAITTPIAAAVALAACGGAGGGNGQKSASPAGTVSERHLSGVGNVLVDPTNGKPLYTPAQEASGQILCTAACTAFWKPLTASAGKPTAPAGAGKLGVITRPGGTKQITADGKPLYTFVKDSPGKATGNGFTDQFAGHRFTWHVVHPGGNTSTGGGNGGGGGGGYAAPSSGQSGY